MKIFISYSVADIDILHQVAAAIRFGGDEPLCWDASKVPGQEVWPSIFQWIDSCDLVVVIITDKTVARAMAVGQEVGRARAKGKTIVPLVSAGVNPNELGFLSGIIYEQINHENPAHAMQSMQRAIHGMKLKKTEERNQLFVLAGLVGLMFLIGQGE